MRRLKMIHKLKTWLENTQFVRHISFLWHWKNFFFLLKYPFWKYRNAWNGKFLGYAYTEYESIPLGWRNAFGKQLSDEIKAAGKKSRKVLHRHLSWKKLVYFQDIKEKYGSLCLYASATPEIEHVLEKYEILSGLYCIDCGKKAVYRTEGWIENYCADCFEKELLSFYGDSILKNADEIKRRCRISDLQLPSITRWEGDDMVEVDLKEEYGIDLEAWKNQKD